MKILLILIVAPIDDDDVNEQLGAPRQGVAVDLQCVKVETDRCPVFLDKLYRVTVQYEP